MKAKPVPLTCRIVATLLLICAAQVGAAIDFGDEFALHGYGSQDYAQTSANTYFGADHRGTWDDNFLAFVGTVSLSERSKLWAQLETSSLDVTRFTWFFVDYQLTASATVHVGRVKFPLGLYNEIIDAKFLQLSSLEPLLYQAAADFVHDSYTGAGLDYNKELGSAGRIVWQVYGGNNYDTDPPTTSRDRRMFGGRMAYSTPVEGLRLMASVYRTQVEKFATGALIDEDRWIASLEYLHADWDLKSEYGRHSFDGVDSYGYYVQGGRTFAEKWTPFVRYDHVVTDRTQSNNEAFFQKDFVGGINYKLLGNVSLRAEVHTNNGVALPVASGETNPAAAKRNWTMFLVGLHFIY